MDTVITLLFNGSENAYLDAVAMFATKAWTWLPLYAAILYVLVREHTFRQLIIIFGGLLLAVVVADQMASTVFKPLVCRLRPTHDPSIMDVVDVVNGYRGGRYGFFSSHAANTIAVATYLSLLFRHRITTLSLYFWAALNCWTRLYLGVHFMGDILTGAIFGFAIGYAFHLLLRHVLVHYSALTPVTMHHGSHTDALPTYSSSRLSVITTTILLLMMIITVPWRLYF